MYNYFKESSEPRVVETSCGSIKGIVSKSRDGREFDEWRGIPFGKPPIGPLRFASPQPFGPWEKVRDGSKFGPRCPEIGLLGNAVGDEDCLYLNVAAPRVDTMELLPVMFFIHGGAFQSGCGSIYQPHFFMDENVILVTTNYRLGVLGFLNTGDTVIRGNMGLKDQALALRWVKDNIQYFGGNPNRITVFGESAGGASVHYLMLSPTTQGLFTNAISQSGVASEPWGIDTTEDAVKYSLNFAKRFGCPTDDSEKIAEILRSKGVLELLKEYKIEMGPMFSPHKESHFMRPSIEAVDDEEAFLVEHPLEILAKGKAHKVPWMMGVNADEGLLTSLLFYNSHQKLESFERNWDNCILWTFGIPKDTPNAPELAEKIKEIYFPKDTEFTIDQKIQQFTKLFSDAQFNLHMSHTIAIQRKFSPVYPYYFSRRGGPSLTVVLDMLMKRSSLAVKLLKFLATTLYNKVTGNKPTDYGVCHGDDLAMLFALEKIFNVRKDPNCEDYKFSKAMVKLWVDFACDETSMTFQGVNFPPLGSNNSLQYFEICESPKLIEEPFGERTDILKSMNFLPLPQQKGKL